MSRGIGKLQQKILSHLAESGAWCWAVDVVNSLWIQEGRPGKPSRSFQVSIWRAIVGLRKRHLVRSSSCRTRCQTVPAGSGGTGLAVWLPGHSPPDWDSDNEE